MAWLGQTPVRPIAGSGTLCYHIDFYHRLALLEFPFQHLRLYALGRPEQVAMKIVALREQDLADLEILLPQLSKEEKKVVVEIMNHVGTFRPDWAQKMQYFLEEQGWEIN